MTDPIFGHQFRHELLLMGSVGLVVAMLCLFTNKMTMELTAWLSLNFIIYRILLWNMGWHHSSGFMIEPFKLSLGVTDVIFSAAAALLLAGSAAIICLERRMIQTAGFLKMCCPACGIHLRFDDRNLGQKIPCPHCQKNITLRKPDLLKVACFFCKEHVEFPSHAIGEKILCPHCKMDITLKEPA